MVDFNRELIVQRVPAIRRKWLALAQQAVIEGAIADAREYVDQQENQEGEREPEQ